MAREKLPRERRSINRNFHLADFSGTIVAGMYDDGRIGEVFVRVDKQGTTVSGLVDAVAIAVSIGLQYGVPLQVFVDKYRAQRFDPQGMVPGFGYVSSILDLMFRWLDQRFPGGRLAEETGDAGSA